MDRGLYSVEQRVLGSRSITMEHIKRCEVLLLSDSSVLSFRFLERAITDYELWLYELISKRFYQ
jgi:hypothetical protein